MICAMHPPRVCYMGIASPEYSRTKVYISGLRSLGVEVVECFDSSPGLRKFFALYRKHRALKGSYDVLIIGNPSYILVPFARLISRKPILFDAGWAFYEGMVLARGIYKHNPLGRAYIWLIDWLAAHSADLITLETHAQVDFYTALLRVKRSKCRVLYTGCDETTFHPDPSVPKLERFTAVFRGKVNPEAGLEHILATARLVENECDVVIYSPRFTPPEIPANVRVVSEYLPLEELPKRLLECHVAIGQMGKHDRLHHTIPHKAFEAAALGLPYIAVKTRAIAEFLEDGESGVFIPSAAPEELAAAMRKLHDTKLQERLGQGARRAFERLAAQQVLAPQLLTSIRELAR